MKLCQVQLHPGYRERVRILGPSCHACECQRSSLVGPEYGSMWLDEFHLFSTVGLYGPFGFFNADFFLLGGGRSAAKAISDLFSEVYRCLEPMAVGRPRDTAGKLRSVYIPRSSSAGFATSIKLLFRLATSAGIQNPDHDA